MKDTTLQIRISTGDKEKIATLAHIADKSVGQFVIDMSLGETEGSPIIPDAIKKEPAMGIGGDLPPLKKAPSPKKKSPVIPEKAVADTSYSFLDN